MTARSSSFGKVPSAFNDPEGDYNTRQATRLSGYLKPLHALGNGSCASAIKSSHNTTNATVTRHSCSKFVANHYQFVRELMSGSFSRVQLLRDRRSGEERVLKICEKPSGSQECQMLKNEIQILSKLDHPHIVKLYEYTQEPHELMMVLEYVSGGDCEQLLKISARPQDEAFVAKLISQVLSAIAYCHARGIVHCDIKPENMMLTRPMAKSRSPNCKLIDFGLTHRTDLPTYDFVGTPAYVAPEIVTGKIPYTVKADIWSVGVTALELLTGEALFGKPHQYGNEINPIIQKIKNFTRIEDEGLLVRSRSWLDRTSDAQDFVKHILLLKHTGRPEAAEARGHAWFETHEDAAPGLTRDMLRSMASFLSAPPIIRRCLLIIASKTGTPDLEKLGSVFVGIDQDRDGMLSHGELAEALFGTVGKVPGNDCWSSGADMDPDDFFDAADQDARGMIGFRHFVAACLFERGDTVDKIAIRTFDALDSDRDGLVTLEEIRHLFRKCDLKRLAQLPAHKAFDVDEWRLSFRATGFGRMARDTREDGGGGLVGVFGRLMDAIKCKPQIDEDEDDYE